MDAQGRHSEPTDGTRPVPADLPGPRMPADRGLTGLGLLMQLWGSIGVAVAVGLGLFGLLAPGAGGLLLFAALCGVRAAFHRAAGTALLYGAPGEPLRALRVYIAVAFAHTTLMLLFVHDIGDGPLVLRLALLLSAWPAVLAVVSALPRLRRAAGACAAPPADLGFESAAVLMTALAALGAALASLVLMLMFARGDALLSSPAMALAAAVFALLVVRAALHLRAGLHGLGGGAAAGAAARYCRFGAASGCAAGGVVLVAGSLLGGLPLAIAASVTVTAVLWAWPAVLRRFFIEQTFVAQLSGASEVTARRAPDAGLTALGWVLLAAASASLSQAVVTALLDPPDAAWLLADQGGTLPSPWWAALAGALQLWAAIELLRMSDRHRLVARLYGVVAAAVALYGSWPLAAATGDLWADLFAGDGLAVVLRTCALAPTLVSLSLALVTIALVGRTSFPGAVIAHHRPHRA